MDELLLRIRRLVLFSLIILYTKLGEKSNFRREKYLMGWTGGTVVCGVEKFSSWNFVSRGREMGRGVCAVFPKPTPPFCAL
jgi:hypothetical protein